MNNWISLFVLFIKIKIFYVIWTYYNDFEPIPFSINVGEACLSHKICANKSFRNCHIPSHSLLNVKLVLIFHCSSNALDISYTLFTVNNIKDYWAIKTHNYQAMAELFKTLVITTLKLVKLHLLPYSNIFFNVSSYLIWFSEMLGTHGLNLVIIF